VLQCWELGGLAVGPVLVLVLVLMLVLGEVRAQNHMRSAQEWQERN
jgi:hypothetical protein